MLHLLHICRLLKLFPKLPLFASPCVIQQTCSHFHVYRYQLLILQATSLLSSIPILSSIIFVKTFLYFAISYISYLILLLTLFSTLFFDVSGLLCFFLVSGLLSFFLVSGLLSFFLVSGLLPTLSLLITSRMTSPLFQNFRQSLMHQF